MQRDNPQNGPRGLELVGVVHVTPAHDDTARAIIGASAAGNASNDTTAPDHAPLHLSLSASFRPKRRFRFELFWAKLEGFKDAVQDAWKCDENLVDPFQRLDALFRNTATALQAWGQKRVGNVKLQMAIANLVVLRLDAAQDRRQLSGGEAWLRKSLKLSLLGLASLERTIARQRSRICWLREGDANTKLFHAVANGRRIKNFIPAVQVGDEIITDQERKLHTFTDAYQNLLGRVQTRQFSLNLDFLQLPMTDLSGLEEIFTEDEVWRVIRDLPLDRAPGPDGFIGIFYQKAWPIIKQDIMAAILKLFVGDGRGFGKLNQALITLIPKKPDAILVGDYRPISLVHSFSKLFSKLLANRLKFRLGELVRSNQSVFVRGALLAR
jgi:hypothetical protein